MPSDRRIIFQGMVNVVYKLVTPGRCNASVLASFNNLSPHVSQTATLVPLSGGLLHDRRDRTCFVVDVRILIGASPRKPFQTSQVPLKQGHAQYVEWPSACLRIDSRIQAWVGKLKDGVNLELLLRDKGSRLRLCVNHPNKYGCTSWLLYVTSIRALFCFGNIVP